MQETASVTFPTDEVAAQDTVRNHKYWRGFFQDVVQEYDYRPLQVEGQLPEVLNGTYYQNGPANFSSHGDEYSRAIET